MLPLIGGAITAVAQIAKLWLEKKVVKQQGEIEVAKTATEGKIKRLQTREEGDIAWENTALINTGIKDEIMMFVILLPMVLCFFPTTRPWIEDGFRAMRETLPTYWEYAFYSLIAVSFGLRKWIDVKSIMKGA